MTEEFIFIIHPGYITSRNDGDIHWISSGKLAKLYGLKQGEYWVEDHKFHREDYFSVLLRREDLATKGRIIDLYPQYSGNYTKFWEKR